MERKEMAVKYFVEYKMHCSQAILMAFKDLLKIDEETALSISSTFGGGMRKGEMCGCITGGLMVLGMLYGPKKKEELSREAEKKGAEFINKFKEENGSYLCRELLKSNFANSEEAKCIIAQGLTKRKCPCLIESAVLILEGIINEGN